MKDQELQALLARYVQGHCSPDEVTFIDSWFMSLEKNLDDNRLNDEDELENLETKLLERIKERLPVHQKASIAAAGTKRHFSQNIYRAAAVLAFILFSSTAWLWHSSRQGGFTETNSAVADGNIKQVTNTTRKVSKHRLPDGTYVELQPNGRIVYPGVFTGATREIQLTGEAFFDVTRNRERPFIISTGNITVKVLGTSFNIKACKGSEEISVAVKTGKVSVFAKRLDPKVSSIQEEIILTPNQEVIYNTIKENFSRRIVDKPRVIVETPGLFQTHYDAAPVNKIFDELEENYGIDIVYDEQVLTGCSLTTSMDEEGLYERIIIICQAIGAQYELIDGKIHISSNGCL